MKTVETGAKHNIAFCVLTEKFNGLAKHMLKANARLQVKVGDLVKITWPIYGFGILMKTPSKVQLETRVGSVWVFWHGRPGEFFIKDVEVVSE